jgi:hypothetical protein
MKSFGLADVENQLPIPIPIPGNQVRMPRAKTWKSKRCKHLPHLGLPPIVIKILIMQSREDQAVIYQDTYFSPLSCFVLHILLSEGW